MRARLHPRNVYVIPNGIDSCQFTYDRTKVLPSVTNIVVVNRLTYRKGVDLLVGLIPIVI